MNEVILRLKNSIDRRIVDEVDKKLMGELMFVPISIRRDCLFVAVSKNSDKDRINSELKRYFENPIRFMLVGADDLAELLGDFVPASTVPAASGQTPQTQAPQTSNPAASSPVTPPSGTSKSKIGEMLVAKGVLTQQQLESALTQAGRTHTPIGSMLYEMGFISLEQLKQVLNEQTGYELVSTEQLTKQKDVADILPEEFIKTNSVRSKS